MKTEGRKKYSLDFSLKKGRTNYYGLYMEYPDTVSVASYPEFLHLSQAVRCPDTSRDDLLSEKLPEV